jgi:serine/threonine protein phosphatase 1
MLVAIGDIHGYQPALTALMARVFERINPYRDTVVFLGDYVDGGGLVRELVMQLRGYQERYPHWVFLLGNHEQMLLDALDCIDNRLAYLSWYTQGGAQTLASYPNGYVSEDDVAWFRSLPLWHETDGFYFVHAGLLPGKRPDECERDDLLWIREPFLHSDERWPKRVIHGHTYTPTPQVRPNRININTMNRGGGTLTAALLDDACSDHQEFITVSLGDAA